MDTRASHLMDYLGACMGLYASATHIKRTRKGTCMATVENIAVITFLLLMGAGITLAALAGLIYFLETMDD